MLRQEHEFTMDIFDADGQLLGRSAVSPDWASFAECVHFSGIRRRVLAPVMTQPPADLSPLWHAERGAPLVAGVRIEMSGLDGQRHGEDFPLDCFRSEARRLSGAYVAAGTLKAGDVFQYQVRAARLATAPAPSARVNLVEVEEIEQPLVMTESCLQEFLDRSLSLGGRSGTDDDVLPVFVAEALVAQCVDLVRAAGELETGGILIGRMRCQASAGDAGIFLEITAQIPGEHTEQKATQLTFTDKTWAAARDALAQRRSDEIILGWWHSHPDFCRGCAPEKRADCSLNRIFFSTTDCALHRTIFPRAFHAGLLFSNRPAGIIPALFGWQRGVVAARPFHLLAPRGEHPDPQLIRALGAGDGPILATVGGDETHGNAH